MDKATRWLLSTSRCVQACFMLSKRTGKELTWKVGERRRGFFEAVNQEAAFTVSRLCDAGFHDWVVLFDNGDVHCTNEDTTSKLLSSAKTDGHKISPDVGRCLEFLDQVKSVLIERGTQYGDSAFRPGRFGTSPSLRCLTRLDEKIARLETQVANNHDYTDTLTDIVGWVAILAAVQDK